MMADDNAESVLCIIHGQSLPFRVNITDIKTVEQLKEQLKIERATELGLLEIDAIKLWRVTIPPNDGNDLPVLLDRMLVRGKGELRNRRLLSYYKLGKNAPSVERRAIQIIIKGPSPSASPAGSPAAAAAAAAAPSPPLTLAPVAPPSPSPPPPSPSPSPAPVSPVPLPPPPQPPAPPTLAPVVVVAAVAPPSPSPPPPAPAPAPPAPAPAPPAPPAPAPPAPPVSPALAPPLPSSLQVQTRTLPLKSVTSSMIGQELDSVLSSIVNLLPHNTPDSIDPNAVEAAQRKILGPFYKTELPYKITPNKLRLVMLGLILDKEPTTRQGKTLRSFVESDIGGGMAHRVVAIVGPAGSGKTATVIDIAKSHFVIYCACGSSAEFTDLNFQQLALDVDNIHSTIVQRSARFEVGHAARAPDVIDAKLKRMVGDRVELEFLGRLLFLLILSIHDSTLQPFGFFLKQTTREGGLTIQAIIAELQIYDSETINLMLYEVFSRLRQAILVRKFGLVIALDEAQVPAQSILPGKVISPSALVRDQDRLYDHKGMVKQMYCRGFLTILSARVSMMQVTTVVLGTALSLQNARRVLSAIKEREAFERITCFPHFDERDVSLILDRLIDMSGCQIPPAMHRKLTGRPRWVIEVVKSLFDLDYVPGHSKQDSFVRAVAESIETSMGLLQDATRTILSTDITGAATQLLCRMLLAHDFHDGKMSFESEQEFDLVNGSLCRLQPDSRSLRLILNEPMVLEAVRIELKAANKDAQFVRYMSLLTAIIDNFGITTTVKGNLFEPLVRRALQRFNGRTLPELGFLDGVRLPAWCNTATLQISDAQTAEGFGFKDDLDFLCKCPPNKMLIPANSTRPDGLWFFPDTNYAGSLAIKLYTSPIPSHTHIDNKASSNIRACFLKSDGQSVNTSTKRLRSEFEANATRAVNLKGILRIHVEIPSVGGAEYPVTGVITDPLTGAEDVMVYINLLNMHTFFDMTIEETSADVKDLMELIKFLSSKSR